MPGKYGAFEQNQIISKARKKRINVQIFLKNGTTLKGKIHKFDIFTLLLKTNKGYILIFKHAISTIIPIKSKSTRKNEKKPNPKNKKRK